MRCGVCGRDELLPFKCAYCGEFFCAEHRIPEKHSCPGVFAAKSPEEIKRREARAEAGWGYAVAPPPRGIARARERIFSADELSHLAAGAALVMLAGFALSRGVIFSPAITAFMLIGFAASFIAHELAHKFVALRRGLSARFKIYAFGAALTAITSLIVFIGLPFFIIIAPGAVVIWGAATHRHMGKVALAGPLTNIAIAIALIPLQPLLPQYPLRALAHINAFLAFFNLIPIGPLDGQKIMSWNTTIWVAAFVASLALFFAVRMVF